MAASYRPPRAHDRSETVPRPTGATREVSAPGPPVIPSPGIESDERRATPGASMRVE